MGKQYTGTCFAVLFLGVLAAVALHNFGLCIFRVWFYKSDEYVIAGEVIRFAQGSFRQHFFDMPGTPYIALCALLWAGWHGLLSLAGGAGGLNLAGYTYGHLPELFYFLRGVTLFFYLASYGLLYVLARRLMNTGGAMAATLLLALSLPYADYSSFVRVESLTMCLILGALLLAVRWLDLAPEGWAASAEARAWHLRFACVGLLIGWAAAARLHSLTLTVPVMFFLFGLRERQGEPAKAQEKEEWSGLPWPGRIWLAIAMLSGGAWVALWVAPLLPDESLRQEFLALPAAVQLARTASLSAMLGSLLIVWAWRGTRWRALAGRWAGAGIGSVAAGVVAGLATGLFPLATQLHYLAVSLQFYSTGYLDRARMLLPFPENVRQYLGYFLHQFVPDPVTLALSAAGMIWIAVERRRALAPFLLAALLFFVSRPLNLVVSPHHVILWLPVWYLCAAYPVARAWAWRAPYGPAAACALLAAVMWSAPNGPKQIGSTLAADYHSRSNVARATDWMKARLVQGEVEAVSFYCFNEPVFYAWMDHLEVPVPESSKPPGRTLIWWGHRRDLAGQRGFVCATPRDVELTKGRVDLAEPGQGTDPYREPAFRRVATFGSGASQVDVFRFDLRSTAGQTN